MRSSDVMEQVQEVLESELEDVAITATARGLVLKYEDSGECFLLPNPVLIKGAVVDDDDDAEVEDFDDEDDDAEDE